MNRYEGKVAVITGGAKGIGAAVARRLASEGAKIALIDLNKDQADEVLDDISAQGGEGLAIQCDVSDRKQVEDSMRNVMNQFSRLDILVNNAGVTRDKLIHKMSDEDWDMVIDIHLKGSFYCCRAAIPYMVKQNYGKIIMMSSRAALGNRGQANYSTAKAGLQGMARALSLELGPYGINVNSVAPGFVESDMTRLMSETMKVPFEKLKESVIQANAIKRVGTPGDVANAVAFLASDEAEFITGQVLYITGRPTV